MTDPNPLLGLANLDDDSVAALVAQHVTTVAWTEGLGWLTYASPCWTVHQGAEGSQTVTVQRHVMDWLKPLALDAVAAVAPTNAGQAQRYVRLLSQSRLETLLRALKRHVQQPLDAWDRHPHLLTTPTGVVDLRDGSVQPPSEALRSTRSTSVGYRAGATHEDWERALQSQPAVDDRAWLQASLGSGCWGRQRGDSLGLLTGHGANGKSTVTGAVVAALGDYASVVDRSVIVGSGHEEHRAGLRGLRLALVEELEDGHRLNMAEVKGLLGTEEVVGRHLYQAPVVFRAQFTLMVTTNYKPQVPDTDHGTWRRLDRLDFGLKYEGEDLDRDLRRRCREDPEVQEAVLAWLVEGAMTPVPEPTPAMKAAKEEWREEADTIAAFIRDHCHVDPDAWTPRPDLYGIFRLYLEEQGQKPWTARTFHARWAVHPYVEDLRLTMTTRQGTQGWQGLRLDLSEAMEVAIESKKRWS